MGSSFRVKSAKSCNRLAFEQLYNVAVKFKQQFKSITQPNQLGWLGFISHPIWEHLSVLTI